MKKILAKINRLMEEAEKTGVACSQSLDAKIEYVVPLSEEFINAINENWYKSEFQGKIDEYSKVMDLV